MRQFYLGSDGRGVFGTRFAIQVVYPSGDVAYLRHGGNAGAIVQFRDRQTADVNRDFIRRGLDADTHVLVVRYQSSMEHT